MVRWFEVFVLYDFEVQYCVGRSYNNVDVFSCRFCVEQECLYCNRIENKEFIDRLVEEQ